MSRFSRSIMLPIVFCLVAFQAHLSLAQVQNIPPTTAPVPAGGLIAKACEQANHKAFCINLLNSDKNSQGADLRGLAYIALRLAEKNATATSLFIKLTLNKPEAAGSDGLTECSELFVSAVELIEDSISSLVSDKYDDVNNLAKSAAAELDTCDGSLQGQVGSALEVANKNRDIRLLINTALTIARVAAASVGRPAH
ncbi:OLC1v1004306C1 [Oldenlandia corymbosa var. corymbosa]|uniref:OLC1v1004306C1 n=1 Tax=Oldenlandia corymbosa var. corymbosa TaxID=529605 RepID=A0AAV1DC92_OLDCO|nr:OLC1v1004306C1 [Oldenlandia corymbosa var. corymbosa]